MLGKLSFLLLGIFIFSACDNELKLVTDGDPYPVVYGVIAPEEARQFVRVEKSFIDKEKGASVLAQDPNNLYYENITVLLKNPEGSNTVALERINAEDLGYEREDGIFAKSPNYVYSITSDKLTPLLGSDDIQVQVINDQDSILAESTTKILRPVRLSRPSTFIRDEIFLIPEEESSVRFRDAYNNILFDFEFEIYITETKDGVETQRVIDWTSNKKITISDVGIDALGMYEKLAAELEVDRNITRSLDSLYMTVYGYGKDFQDYLLLDESNDGITASSEVPVYSNITNGYGLFTGRSKLVDGPFFLNGESMIEIRNNDIVVDLNFR